jgi:hypothetical protein
MIGSFVGRFDHVKTQARRGVAPFALLRSGERHLTMNLA